MTFKADYLAPCLVGNNQEHDALGDCMNQLELYKLTKGKYANQGTIYANMLAHHKIKHDDNKRLGGSQIDWGIIGIDCVIYSTVSNTKNIGLYLQP